MFNKIIFLIIDMIIIIVMMLMFVVEGCVLMMFCFDVRCFFLWIFVFIFISFCWMILNVVLVVVCDCVLGFVSFFKLYLRNKKINILFNLYFNGCLFIYMFINWDYYGIYDLVFVNYKIFNINLYIYF